jgi:lysozyme
MQISEKGIAAIERSEGSKCTPYMDGGGVPTIGIGCIRYEDGSSVTMQDCEISKERVQDLFRNGTLPQFETAVKAAIHVPLEQHEYDALVSLAYNIGTTGFKGSTLVKLLNAGVNRSEVAPQFLRWTKDNGKVVQGLTNRRTAEMNMFLGK